MLVFMHSLKNPGSRTKHSILVSISLTLKSSLCCHSGFPVCTPRSYPPSLPKSYTGNSNLLLVHKSPTFFWSCCLPRCSTPPCLERYNVIFGCIKMHLVCIIPIDHKINHCLTALFLAFATPPVFSSVTHSFCCEFVFPSWGPRKIKPSSRATTDLNSNPSKMLSELITPPVFIFCHLSVETESCC